MQFYFIRHAQSTNNRLYDQTGSWKGRSHDPELTDIGLRQAERLGQSLRQAGSNGANGTWDPQNVNGFGITHVYSSLMIRAAHTGSIVARALELPLMPWDDLHETGGMYLDDEATGEKIAQPGLARAEMAERFPNLVLPDSMYESGWWNRPFEEPEQWLARARRVLDELTTRHGSTNDHVAVISHGGFYYHLMTTLLGMPATDGFWFLMNNTGITRIDFEDDHVTLMYQNRVDFLPRDLIT